MGRLRRAPPISQNERECWGRDDRRCWANFGLLLPERALEASIVPPEQRLGIVHCRYGIVGRAATSADVLDAQSGESGAISLARRRGSSQCSAAFVSSLSISLFS
jgi:hypothetical protein